MTPHWTALATSLSTEYALGAALVSWDTGTKAVPPSRPRRGASHPVAVSSLRSPCYALQISLFLLRVGSVPSPKTAGCTRGRCARAALCGLAWLENSLLFSLFQRNLRRVRS